MHACVLEDDRPVLEALTAARYAMGGAMARSRDYLKQCYEKAVARG